MKHLIPLLGLVAGIIFLAGCSTPSSRIAKQPDVFSRLTPEQQQMVKEGRVGLGFDAEMVKLALGNPDSVRERVNANGRTEVWAYINYETLDGMYLYRGWYHHGWGGPYGYYPYYMNYPDRIERSRDEVVFRDGRVISIDKEM